MNLIKSENPDLKSIVEASQTDPNISNLLNQLKKLASKYSNSTKPSKFVTKNPKIKSSTTSPNMNYPGHFILEKSDSRQKSNSIMNSEDDGNSFVFKVEEEDIYNNGDMVSQLESPEKNLADARPKYISDDFLLNNSKVQVSGTNPRNKRIRSNSENTDQQQNNLFEINNSTRGAGKGINLQESPELDAKMISKNMFKKSGSTEHEGSVNLVSKVKDRFDIPVTSTPNFMNQKKRALESATSGKKEDFNLSTLGKHEKSKFNQKMADFVFSLQHIPTGLRSLCTGFIGMELSTSVSI